ncbi:MULTISPECIES: relaxase/mobilization nuclease domain-containing protein [unclassified Shinella]|uniref:relaxase/mobilization nuclease domain-containing protein n=1 Tax=unclassified Shinella TaxID=2643062 RepID=UPI00225C9544|nr:relaxase/mobilization nuclease domain-containing protein [Shinella sp. YE25]MDC7260109.1 relaxase/mobilization nuclease domain-containing protein [Shinella sp. YE25]CAI0341154.1 Relaxase/mobilization nuclease domain-containing protein [Rhizobiaceae bacterium]CAK7262188.1 Relaxase/mobilization nuclease domain-containing protein [Shinella sp. WSC3-e]
MAYDWSGLLGDIESFTVQRAKSLLDEEDERRRRAGAMRIALTAEAPQPLSMPSGIGRKSRMAAVAAHETTIDAILQPAQGAPREIIALVGTLGAGANPEMDDELQRQGGGGGGSTKGPSFVRSHDGRPTAAKQASAESTSRAAIAAGAQPVVIKVTSTVSSRASAAGLMTYLGTREVEKESGEKGKADIPIFDQDGAAIASREERAAALQAWVSEFREPYALDAVANLSIKPADAVSDEELHDALNAAFGAKPFLYSRHQDGSVSVYAVTSLPARKIAGALRAREKDEGPARTLDKAEADIAGRMSDAGVSAEVRVVGAAVSEKSGRYFLERFLRSEKHVVTSAGEAVKRGAAVKDVADGIWRGWSADIRTVEPRNAFHVIFSARAGTDVEAMKHAVRDFLSEQVAGHRWITAPHPGTGHVHVHAMISARDDVGKALRLTKPELYAWREGFAAKAREHGIAMVATRRADVAATRPYSQAQAGAYERGRADPRYLKSATVNQRVERKRAGVADHATLANGNLALAPIWQATAIALKEAGAKPSVIAAADRFAAAAAQPAKGFVLLRVAVEQAEDQEKVATGILSAIGVGRGSVLLDGNMVAVLMPTSVSVSKVERELARQTDEFGPSAEMQEVSRDAEARLLRAGLKAAVTVEAADSGKDGAPTAWLQNRFDAHRRRAHAKPATPLRT